MEPRATLLSVSADELAEAYHDAMGRGPNWRKRIGASLERMPEARGRLAALPG